MDARHMWPIAFVLAILIAAVAAYNISWTVTAGPCARCLDAVRLSSNMHKVCGDVCAHQQHKEESHGR